MFFPEFLYKLSARDEQVTWLDPVTRRLSITNAAIFCGVDLLLPEGRALVLTQAICQTDPGAGQNVVSMRIYLQGPDQITHDLVKSNTALAANLNGNLDWQGEVIVLPGWRLGLEGEFNAAVAANVTSGSFMGLSIPIGNIQRV